VISILLCAMLPRPCWKMPGMKNNFVFCLQKCTANVMWPFTITYAKWSNRNCLKSACVVSCIGKINGV
jgi:hypothetical protein